MSHAVELTIEPRERPVGAGTVRRLLPHRTRRMVGPFIFADVIGPEELAPGAATSVDAHPHIGMSTLTYLLSGRMVHRDSTGAVATIEPGGVNWMTAGGGVTHTERSHPDDVPTRRDLHGLQTWVALPAEDADGQPSFTRTAAAEVPVVPFDASQVRLAVGTGWGETAPIEGSSPLVLAELRLADGADVIVDATHPERAVLAVDGDVRIDDQTLAAGRLAVLHPGENVRVGGTGTAMLLGGAPVGPRHIWWNFVHHDPERIEQAKSDWMAQRFPTVPGDHDPWVPLPS